MVAGAVRLLATQGPPGASFGDVLKETGAARGSTYHHFPGGKEELYRAALDLASDRALRALEPVRGQPADVVVERFFAMWRALLTETDLRAGCAVLAVAVAGEPAQIRDDAGQIFRSWQSHLESLFVEGGLTPTKARSLAALTMTSAEGAVAIARAERDLETFELVAQQVLTITRQSMPVAKRI
ncbi:TetR/AcrR family transcriptional regulator [Angustibacter sp. McL0619]|uniref:TetR/AcrR family transcriptional regulator n=1 Tax=Angustibacter sp. McL0619 TaxID=3415676 RepID=UPI003CF960B1